MDVQWSAGLAWTYFANPDYLVVHAASVLCSYFLIQLTKPEKSPIYIIILSFFRLQWVTCLWTSHVPNSRL